MACHGVINALGFPLEHYDAVGKWRTHEKDTPIDARSIYETDEGVTFFIFERLGCRSACDRRGAGPQCIRCQSFPSICQMGPCRLRRKRSPAVKLHFQKNQFNVKELFSKIAHLVVPYGIHEQPSVSP